MTLRSQILIIIVGVVILTGGAIGLATVEKLETALKTDARRLVSLTARTRQVMLVRALKLRQERARAFATRIRVNCETPDKLNTQCAMRILQDFLVTDVARSTSFKYENSQPLVVGDRSLPATENAFLGARLATFRYDSMGHPYYVIQTEIGANKVITSYYSFDTLNEIFSPPPELGDRGETFLINFQGQFMTPVRFLEVKNTKENLATKACLAGQSGSMIALDYNGVPAIHAFRYVPEIGGGCIKAIVAESQVLVPLGIMKREILGLLLIFVPSAVLLSFLFANRVLLPIRVLAKRVAAFEAGDLDSPVPSQGPPEIRQFGDAFTSMAEALRKMIRDREELLAIVSHDLKNPIASIQLNAGLIQKFLGPTELDAESKFKVIDQVSRVLEACRRMHKLVTDLLDLARIEAGYLSINRKPEDAYSISNEINEFFKGLALEKSISLHVRASPDPFLIFCDRDRVFQVMSNLLGNALKFTPENGCITFGFDRSEREAIFFVKDTGPGISSGAISHLFDRFWQAEHAKKKGSGLGLYISQRIVQAHGGRIWVESALGQGSIFRFSIPQFFVSMRNEPEDDRMMFAFKQELKGEKSQDLNLEQ